jgi:hypothetical protein
MQLMNARDAKRGQFDSESKNGRLLAVDIVAKNVSGVTFDVNPYNFKPIGPDGRRYDPTYTSEEPGFNAVTLNPTEQVTGTMVFDVPPGPVKTGYVPLTQTIATWSVPG